MFFLLSQFVHRITRGSQFGCCVVAAFNTELVLIGLHAKPDYAVEEMIALENVHTAVKQHWNTDNIIIMGDLNAECRYASLPELEGLNIRKDPFCWLIGDGVDTTVYSTDCAYDRCAWHSVQITGGAVAPALC